MEVDDACFSAHFWSKLETLPDMGAFGESTDFPTSNLSKELVFDQADVPHAGVEFQSDSWLWPDETTNKNPFEQDIVLQNIQQDILVEQVEGKPNSTMEHKSNATSESIVLCGDTDDEERFLASEHREISIEELSRNSETKEETFLQDLEKEDSWEQAFLEDGDLNGTELTFQNGDISQDMEDAIRQTCLHVPRHASFPREVVAMHPYTSCVEIWLPSNLAGLVIDYLLPSQCVRIFNLFDVRIPCNCGQDPRCKCVAKRRTVKFVDYQIDFSLLVGWSPTCLARLEDALNASFVPSNVDCLYTRFLDHQIVSTGVARLASCSGADIAIGTLADIVNVFCPKLIGDFVRSLKHRGDVFLKPSKKMARLLLSIDSKYVLAAYVRLIRENEVFMKRFMQTFVEMALSSKSSHIIEGVLDLAIKYKTSVNVRKLVYKLVNPVIQKCFDPPETGKSVSVPAEHTKRFALACNLTLLCSCPAQVIDAWTGFAFENEMHRALDGCHSFYDSVWFFVATIACSFFLRSSAFEVATDILGKTKDSQIEPSITLAFAQTVFWLSREIVGRDRVVAVKLAKTELVNKISSLRLSFDACHLELEPDPPMVNLFPVLPTQLVAPLPKTAYTTTCHKEQFSNNHSAQAFEAEPVQQIIANDRKSQTNFQSAGESETATVAPIDQGRDQMRSQEAQNNTRPHPSLSKVNTNISVSGIASVGLYSTNAGSDHRHHTRGCSRQVTGNKRKRASSPARPQQKQKLPLPTRASKQPALEHSSRLKFANLLMEQFNAILGNELALNGIEPPTVKKQANPLKRTRRSKKREKQSKKRTSKNQPAGSSYERTLNKEVLQLLEQEGAKLDNLIDSVSAVKWILPLFDKATDMLYSCNVWEKPKRSCIVQYHAWQFNPLTLFGKPNEAFTARMHHKGLLEEHYYPLLSTGPAPTLAQIQRTRLQRPFLPFLQYPKQRCLDQFSMCTFRSRNTFSFDTANATILLISKMDSLVKTLLTNKK